MKALQARELRIGNWVEFIQPKKGMYTTVESSTFSINIEKSFKPIPLTEEWLERFGIERDSYDRRKFHFLGVQIYIFPDGRIVFNPESGSIYLELDYVHTLQNLYFLFKNEELTLKE